MADPKRAHPANAPGPWFVDTTCIDCDAARQVAPGLIEEVEGTSVLVRQPRTEEERLAATRALLACPVAAIGVRGEKIDRERAYPMELEGGVYYTGYNARSSFGANAYFVQRPGGNLLVDSPRFLPQLVKRFEALGGLAHILLTHQDDVADADRYAAALGARVWIHEADRRAAPYASELVRGREPVEVREDLLAIPTPGHTSGSMVYLFESKYLFSGDSLYWSRGRGSFSAFSGACWYSWEAQADSLEGLASFPFEWVLPGHGDRQRRPAAEMRERLRQLVAEMRTHGRRFESPW